MNYITHTRAAFAQLSAEPAATAQHVSLYVALFQCWNDAFFPASILLVRDELMTAAHLGSRKTYLTCLRDLTAWGLITYHPSQSQHKPSRAFMHELSELRPEVSQAMNKQRTKLKSEPSHSPSGELSDEQVASQGVGSIIKTVEYEANQANLSNFSNASAADTEKNSSSASPDELLLESLDKATLPGEQKEKVAPKRKVRSHTTQERKAKRPEVPFAESELADLSTFIAAFTGTDFELANLRYYHEKVANWRKDGEPPHRRDWKATAKNFMLNDVERNSLVLAPGSQSGTSDANPSSNSTDSGTYPAGYVSKRYS